MNDIPDYAMTRQSDSMFENSFATMHLDVKQTKSLLQECNHVYDSEINDILLSGLAYALRDWNNNDIQGITLEGHGREDINPKLDITHTVGWFTTMYPVKLKLGDSIGDSIKIIKDNLRSIPNKGIGFGCFAVDEKSRLSFEELPKISFNYLGQFDAKDDFWQIAGESSGISVNAKNKDNNIININGAVIEGKLNFSITSHLSLRETEQLARDFKEHLMVIIEHCKELYVENINYHTISDFNQILKPLFHNEHNKHKIYFIHPSAAGCEVYVNLAKNLFFKYNSYGIDNYNIFNYKKHQIDSLSEMVRIYIAQLKLHEDKQRVIILSGWSLGGKIAMEMAYQLENQGYMNIIICAFDTLLMNETILNHHKRHFDANQLIFEKSMIAKGFDQDYIKKILYVSTAESKIAQEPLSGYLRYTQVILFKALEETMFFNKDIINISDNNIGSYVSSLKIIPLQCNHDNILSYVTSDMLDKILSQNL